MTMARRFARGAQFQVCGIMNWLVLALEHMCHFLARFQKKKNWGKEIKEVFRRFCVSEGHLHANVVVVNYPVCMIVKQAYFIALCPKVTHLAKRYIIWPTNASTYFNKYPCKNKCAQITSAITPVITQFFFAWVSAHEGK